MERKIKKNDLSSSWKNLAALGFTLHKVLVGCSRELAHILAIVLPKCCLNFQVLVKDKGKNSGK
jgi:hypothetical protein